MNKETEKKVADLLLWSDDKAKQLMTEIAGKHGVSVDALAELVAWERDQQECARRRGMTEAFNEIFENKTYWK
ncbi:DNA modification system-associated small protein [Neisseria lisongii]|uniref:CopG family transcriptional regulator n=1 Tax=Neisseria lisongii TaxID=2912188 RepID=A0AAW5ALG6_9NEIS|nr:DNA modification system-associated small protein [Neisseria lisongii]MCF7528947.1 hypothetical protein [Neisseria lisongii]